ncbi:MAG: o-succinylbenzoate synthase [Candidatus Zixiibacteriota bacterium]
MRIAAVELFSYSLPLVRPLPGQPESNLTRKGLLIKLITDSGAHGWGEAAPLPGYSPEKFEDALRQLKVLRHGLTGAVIDENLTRLDGAFDAWLARYDLSPSVRFAFETAIVSTLAQETGKPPAYLLATHPAERLHLNGLITDDTPLLESADRFLRDGYRAVKMKVGRRSLDGDIARTMQLHRTLGNHMSIRLDANRAWSYDDALRLAGAVADCNVEYIEEPLAESGRLREFAERTRMSVALDESLLAITPARLSDHDYVGAIVLKPTLLGGFERAAAFARAARPIGIKVVISSCFESSLGIAALAQLAAAYGTHDSAMGLDTLGWFQQDLLTEPIDCLGGRIDLVNVSRAALTVNEDLLAECDDE